jgi:hypothetical protein
MELSIRTLSSRGQRLLFIAWLLFSASISAAQNDNGPAILDAIRLEVQRVAELKSWDSTFAIRMEEAFDRAERNFSNEPERLDVYGRMLGHFQAIGSTNKSRVKTDFEELLFGWLSAVVAYGKDAETATEKVIRGFPDSYFPVKVLAPGLLTDSALQVMADLYPKEVLYALRYMVDPDALTEAELAAVNAPFEAKQYFHYYNSVNALLKTSTDSRVVTLYEMFGKYRYGSNSFYLLDLVHKGRMTIAEAHEAGKAREQMYNALIDIYTSEDPVGLYSVEEHLGELSDRYVRKLMFQRYLPASRLNLDQLADLTPEARIYFLFRSQNMLKKKDLQNLARLLKQLDMEVIAGEDMPWLSDDRIRRFQVRLEEESIPAEFDFLLDPTLWARTRDLAEVTQLAGEGSQLLQGMGIDAGGLAEPVFVFQPYISRLNAHEKEVIRLLNNPYAMLSDLSGVTGQVYSRQMILSLAMDHPVEVMAQLEQFQDQPYAADILTKLALHAPLTAKNYLVKKDHRIHHFLKSTPDTNIQKLYEIDKELGNWTRAYILLDKIARGEISIEEAEIISKEKKLLLPHLVELYRRTDYLGQYTVEKELEYAALDFVRAFNISENTDGAFTEALNEIDAATLYTFMIFGEREVISNTFGKMYDRLMALTGHDLPGFLASMDYVHIDRFLRMAVHYGREYDLYRKLNDDDLERIWTAVFRDLEAKGDKKIQAAIEAGEIIVWLQDSRQLRRIHDIIKEEYERLADERHDEGVAAYGILASIMAQKLREGWSVYAASFYKIPDLVAMPVYSLFNDQLVNVQHYYFYNDRDGLYSYRNFLQQYERSKYNWKIEDKGKFIKIASRSGKAVEIYANKPTEGEEGIVDLETYLASNNLSPQVVVHRGLSTHTLKTFRKIPASAKLILDGSCGGFHIQGVALENAPGAHILCNRNIGTMHINDPMFKQISESIREGRDIVWPSFWSDMEARLGSNPYFKDYIPPHKNVAALIIKAYYDVLDINH